MRVLTWNVQGAFPHKAEDEIEAQIEYLAGLDKLPDLLLLNEVNQYRREFIRELLDDLTGSRCGGGRDLGVNTYLK